MYVLRKGGLRFAMIPECKAVYSRRISKLLVLTVENVWRSARLDTRATLQKLVVLNRGAEQKLDERKILGKYCLIQYVWPGSVFQ